MSPVSLAPESRVFARPDTIIAIPVRNEAERIARCLTAIDRQTGLAPGRLGLVLFLNNCTDDTARIVAEQVPTLSIPVRVIERSYAGAHAGWARRAAMDAASAWLEGEGSAPAPATILTTDADSIVPPDWVAGNLAALEAGADAVAGRVELIPEEAALLPPSLPARGRLEDTYDALITEMEARIDPDPHDPWPCHRTTIGAGAFIGSNSALVAPVTVGAGAYVGSGSTITADVPEDALALARGRQVVKAGWSAAFRRGRDGGAG